MIIIYTKKSSGSSRKAIAWLKKNKIAYKERVVSNHSPLSPEEIIKMLSLTEDIYEIVSKRSKTFKELDRDVEEMSLNSELIPFISENIDILTWPIAIQRNKIQVGFSEETFRRFIPRDRRKEEVTGMLAELWAM